MLKAIQTQYKGYKFRSRLEARWAVFFDTMGFDWEYEPEGFDLGDGVYYLPDFRITTRQGFYIWIEVKPHTSADDGKMGRLNLLMEKSETIGEFSCRTVSGDPIEFLGEEPHKSICPGCGDLIGNESFGCNNEPDFLYNYCFMCDCKYGTDNEFHGVFCEVNHHKGMNEVEWSNILVFKSQCRAAAVRARQARFEHGETPC